MRWRLARGALSGAGALALLWVVGFGWFVWIAFRSAPPPPRAGGIVVLTGGQGRIAAALRLLYRGRAPLLLISGVAPGVRLADLPRTDHIHLAALAPRITLGHSARSTRGNASEAAAWVAAHRLRSLIVVTAGYHMARALIEFRRAMPGLRLYPDPVHPPALLREPRIAMVRLLADEYMKWIVARAGLSGVVHRLARGGAGRPLLAAGGSGE